MYSPPQYQLYPPTRADSLPSPKSMGVARIFSALVAARGQVVNIFILLFVFMTCFSLIGMQLFGGKCGAEDGSRYHFDYFVPSMITVSWFILVGLLQQLLSPPTAHCSSSCFHLHRCSSFSLEDGLIRTRLVQKKAALRLHGSTS